MPEEQQMENKTEEIKLDRKSKILFAVLAVFIAGSVAVTYYRYMIKKDYIIESQIDCDPETENCFIWKCDPNSLEQGEECTGVPDNDIWYYKIFRRNAKNIPLCDPKDENCAALTCPEGEKGCEEILCTAETVKKSEECSNPKQYLLENPPEEESVECAEGDEECAKTDTDEECAPDDEECLNQAEQEGAEESDSPTTDETTDEVAPQKDAVPAGVEPM